MLDNIYLKCNHCEDAHSYYWDETLVVALDGEWKCNIEKEHLLANKPKQEEEYELQIYGPLELDLQEKFWSIYMKPIAQLNGIETEPDIESICFCLNETLELISLNETTVNLKVKVIETINLSRLIERGNAAISWISLLKDAAESRKHYHVSNYSRYSLISINCQSDFGMTLIIEKHENQSWIVAVNEWDFHQNLWFAHSQRLTKEEEEKYGIQ